MQSKLLARTIGSLTLAGFSSMALGQGSADLAPYFGFDEPRIVIVDQNPGPALARDVDGDGLLDLIVVNNAKSRIEIHIQRSRPRTDAEVRRDMKANELPPSRYFDRTDVSVAHRVMALRIYDINADGKQDILYAGRPSEIVVLAQTDRLTFETLSRRRVSDLSSPQDGFMIADVMGDSRPELLAAAGGKIRIYGLSDSAVIDEPVELGSDADIFYFFIEDYNGDGFSDICAAIPDDDSPLRLWLQDGSGSGRSKRGTLGPELRFEMPQLREAEPLRFPNRPAASIAYIERASRRIVLSDLSIETIEQSASVGAGIERDAHAEVHAFPAGADKERSIAVADVNADGLLDVVTTEGDLNSFGLFLQQSGSGIARQQRFSALKDPQQVALGQWDDDAPLEIFVLSEADKAVGVSQFDPKSGRISFPQPLPIATKGAEPVAMAYAALDSGPAVAVIVKQRREHTLELHRPSADQPTTIKLEGVKRPPSSILSGDFDHDGDTDLALFTPSEPLVLVLDVDQDEGDEAQVLTDETMPQFGLVQAAGPNNTALLDVDGDGFAELLIADENFVRACAYEPERGWRVVDQVTMPEASSSLVSLSVLRQPDQHPSIVAYDRGNARLVMMSQTDDGAWEITGRFRLGGFEPSRVFAGAFSGDGHINILGVSDDSMAVVRLSGQRAALEEFDAYRSDEDTRLEHEIEAGDLNSDGYLDLVVLDALEQMCQIFTLSATRRLLLATEFKVFESRLFSGGENREYEPSSAIIADLTGDGRDDLVLEVHDRYIIYPQMVEPK